MGKVVEILVDDESGEDGLIQKGLLKKATSGVLAIFLCSRTESTLRAQN